MSGRIDSIIRNYEGSKMEGPYLVVRSAFHGGGMISKHRSLRRAAEAVARYESPNCACGCVVIVSATSYESLPHASNSRSPYAPAR